jgi:hypothetical protein
MMKDNFGLCACEWGWVFGGCVVEFMDPELLAWNNLV